MTRLNAAAFVVTNVADSGPGSLRDAIGAASDGDSISFDGALFTGSLPVVIDLASKLDVGVTIEISGPAADQLVISGGGTTRVFDVLDNATGTPDLTLRNLTVADGFADSGGGIMVETGATLQLVDCVVRDCSAEEYYGGYGGGLYNAGSTTVLRTLFQSNQAVGAGYNGYGGAIYNESDYDLVTFDLIGATLVIENSQFVSNGAGYGGAIVNYGVMTVSDSELAQNTASETGGGVLNGGIADFVRSLLWDNVAEQYDGGGLVAEYQAITQIESSTISGNSATAGSGGGIALFGSSGEGDPTELYLVSSTVAHNSAATKSGGVYLTNSDGLVSSHGSIIAENVVDDGNTIVATDVFLEWDATLTSLGFNIVQADPGGVWPAGVTGDQIGVDPQIGLLADNGGPTATHALISTSPAIDTGDPLFAGDLSLFDQRGELRVINSRIDIGAFEFESGAVCEDPPVVTLLPDGGGVITPVQVVLPLDCIATYTDPGATAEDCEENPLAVTTTYPPSVSVSAGGVITFPGPGVYLVVYRAIDGEGRESEETRTIEVVDLQPPDLTVPVGPIVVSASDPLVCGAVVDEIDVTVEDCSATEIFFEIEGPALSRVGITFPYQFPVGATTVYVYATDTYDNTSPEQMVTVTVNDEAGPAITLNSPELDNISIPFGTEFPDPGATASDACDGSMSVSTDGSSFVDPCQPGIYTFTYSASDLSGNISTETRTITVEDPEVEIVGPGATVMRDVDPATCEAMVDLGELVEITGLPEDCAASVYIEVLVDTPDEEYPLDLEGLDTFSFPVGLSTVIVQAYLGEEGPIASTSFDVEVSDPFLGCINNVAWPLAYDVPLEVVPAPLAVGEGLPITSMGTVQQFLARAGESRWYRIQGEPGSRIHVTLADLPEDFDLVVYTDIQQTYDELIGLVDGTPEEQILALLGAEFAPEAYSPEAYSPEAYSPEAYSPEAYSPEAYSPEAYSPEAYSPEAYSPEAYSPEAYSPEAYSPEAYSPEAYSPEAYSPEAYSGAQARSLLAFSAGKGTSSEVVRFNTYSRTGDFYIRVRGRNGIFSTAQPFSVTIQLDQEICKNVSDLDATSVFTPSIVGSPTSLILWDSTRVEGTVSEVAELATSLANFAAASNAAVVDVSGDARVNALNAQADANPACPLAKNLVGDTIRDLIHNIRQAAPSIEDITLVGSDFAIPFFRTNDEALLASEANYFPPALDDTHSNSSLRYAQMLTQDRYGSSCEVFFSTGPFDLPDLPVGRLVETAAEIRAYLDTYITLFDGTVGTGGLLPTPESLFVSGYDFLDDAAIAVRDDFALGLGAGAVVDDLIVPFGAAPAEGWTADELRNALLGTRHDLNYLAGHFSQSGALAADYSTRLTSSEIASSPIDFAFAFFMSTGCHSGYQMVDGEAVPVVTEQPDWAQAFMQKLAIWIAGTGYQYGDTDFLEYSERLYLEIARGLRSGEGPVSIGHAIAEAKRRYLADTALMRGIHEKAIVEVALYGLPMVKIDLPGERLALPAPASDVGVTSPVVDGPGTAFGLSSGELVVNPALSLNSKPLDVIGPDGTIVDTVLVSWLDGAAGRVTLPVEPIRPRETLVVSNDAGIVRDVLFLGGSYTDLPAILPLTGAPATEIRGMHGIFSTEVHYPIRPWNLNHIGAICAAGGASVLNAFPAQYISDGAGTPTGTLRRLDRMDFKVFYSPDTSANGLANPPAINVVSSEVDGADIVFTIEVAAGESVGVQEVWVTYTGLPGSALHGSWQSLPLEGPAGPDSAGIGTWTGRLVGGATNEASLCFMVQAVSGIGRVALNSNFGRYFKVGTSTLDGVGAAAEPTIIELDSSIPTSGAYRDSISVGARLTNATGGGLEGKTITFRIGSQVVTALTDAGGNVSVAPVLSVVPGLYQLEASFSGDETFQANAASVPFEVVEQGTVLAIESEGSVGNFSEIVATLNALDGTPLKEKTVIFVVGGSEGETALAVITDGAGRARMPDLEMPAGVYDIFAYFAQPVVLPDGSTVTLSDTLYGPSGVQANVAVGDVPGGGLEIVEKKVTVVYSDKKAPGASRRNRGHGKTTISGDLRFSDPSARPEDVLSASGANSVTANISAMLSGASLVDGELDLRVWGWKDKQWFGTGKVGTTKVYLRVSWLPPVFKSKLSDPHGPDICSINLSDSFALLSFKPVPGTYNTVISGPEGQVTVEVRRGRVKKITGGISSKCGISWWGRSAVVALPFGLKEGDTIVTTGDVGSDIVVTSGVNLLGATGRFTLMIDTPKGHGPLYNDTPAILEVGLTLGTGSGETPHSGNTTIGDSAKPWTKEVRNLRFRHTGW